MGWPGNVLLLPHVISVPTRGIPPVQAHIPLLVQPILSMYRHGVHALYFHGCQVSPVLTEWPDGPQRQDRTCYLSITSHSYLLPPPSQALQRCSVLPVASGHPSGPAPECGGKRWPEAVRECPSQTPALTPELLPLLPSTKSSLLPQGLSGGPPQARPAYLL